MTLIIGNIILLFIYLFIYLFIIRRTITDSTTGKEIVLTDEDIDLIENIQRSQYPQPGFDPYEVSCF